MKAMAALVLALVTVVFSTTAADRFGVDVTGPISTVTKMRATTNTGAIMIPGLITTNFISVSAARFLPIPRDGRFGFFIQTGATNALTVTNCSCIVEAVEFDMSGRTNVISNYTITLTPTVAGAVTASNYNTNWPTVLLNSAAYAGADAFRLRSCTNVNSESIWLSNVLYLRP